MDAERGRFAWKINFHEDPYLLFSILYPLSWQTHFLAQNTRIERDLWNIV